MNLINQFHINGHINNDEIIFVSFFVDFFFHFHVSTIYLFILIYSELSIQYWFIMSANKTNTNQQNVLFIDKFNRIPIVCIKQQKKTIKYLKMGKSRCSLFQSLSIIIKIRP